MIKGDPIVGEDLYLSYNRNVIAIYAGDGLVNFHDTEYSSDEAIRIALEEKCDLKNAGDINLDSIAWYTKDETAHTPQAT